MKSVMSMSTMVLGADDPMPLVWTGLGVAAVLAVVFTIMFIVTRYKRCPSNQILVVYGSVGRDKASKCVHGGGTFVLPLLQDYAYLNLEPMVIDIPLEGALSLNNIRVN